VETFKEKKEQQVA